MLQKNVVTEETYNVLKLLMKDEKFNDFNLAGGTSLDLFTRKDFDAENLKRYLIDNYGFKVKNKYNI